jgi:hypothetical protein
MAMAKPEAAIAHLAAALTGEQLAMLQPSEPALPNPPYGYSARLLTFTASAST